MPTITIDEIIYTTSGSTASATGYTSSILANRTIQSSITIDSVIYPVTSIGNTAFLNSTMTNITIPNSIILIGTSAFQSCTLLNNVIIPNSVTTLFGIMHFINAQG
jgi:hypothetical protein